ncbi:hypothetical protein TRFO_35394 [Tritrichomonas foetus]|uniref:Uncharacterized protein n=1 Tax=Tritrichomonas foetus TaxID=1144522 RepID=A0A1J4JGC3_9EUKA|nr:hypothetical protein TRFO_35394 [Tritrichomonas foetus]|eukprot:OHS98238.1 hypothetical protein TRFO_35394 [Tritrichomonas foetus]
MLFEDDRTLDITVQDTDQRFKIDKAPIDLTVSALILRLKTLDFLKDLKGDFRVKSGGKILNSSQVIENDEVTLLIQPKKIHFIRAFFFLIYQIALASTLLYPKLFSFYGCSNFVTFIAGSALLGVLAMIFKPKRFKEEFAGLDIRSNTFLEVLVLFWKSLNPKFNLETVLLENS